MGAEYLLVDVICIDQKLSGDKLLRQVVKFSRFQRIRKSWLRTMIGGLFTDVLKQSIDRGSC